MATHALDNQLQEKLLNKIEEHDRLLRESRTTQTQGENAIQIGYTPDPVHTINVAPNSGLIGTLIFTLQNPSADDGSVVFGDLDIAVNKGQDIMDSTYNLSAYYGGLKVEVINDLYLVEGWRSAHGYYPVVKVVRLSTFASSTADNFYIHYRWRYVGVGKTLQAVTGDITILP